VSTRAGQHSTTPRAPAFAAASRRLLQRKCACGKHTIGGGPCAECAKRQGGPQNGLTIRLSHDSLEREADRVADQVLAAPTRSAVGDAAPHIQRHAIGHRTDHAPAAPVSVDRVLAGAGRPLDPALQRDMGRRFSYDFSRVRVHADAAAAESVREVNARAYTVGDHVVFGAGEFAPATVAGRRLLAHELTHVVQQSASDGGREGHPHRNVQRQAAERAAQLNDALSRSDWDSAVRVLMELTDSDARSGLAALSPVARARLRTAAVQVDPAPDNRVVRLIEQVEAGAARTAQAPAGASSSTVPRPPALPVQQAFTLLQVTDMDAGTAARIPEGRIVTVVLPPAGPSGTPSEGFGPSAVGSPVSGAWLGGITNINQTLTHSGFAGVPGGNGIGLIGIPRAGTPGAFLPESISTWGHTAVYARVNGQLVISRGYTTGSLVQAFLKQGGIKAGSEAIPAAISSDLSLFTKTGARVIEYPVSGETAANFVKGLPATGAPPPEGPTLYTGRPAAYTGTGATNCVGWACATVESELGGRVGTVGPGGQVDPIAQAATPQQGLQGRFIKATAEGTEIARLPGATGEAVVSGMPRYLKVLKIGGRVFIVVGAVLVVVETVRAPEGQRGRTFVGAGSGFLGGLALGATAGLVCGPGALACSIGLGLVFGLAGYFGGRAIGEGVYDAASGN
jgi:hypothetical protein